MRLSEIRTEPRAKQKEEQAERGWREWELTKSETDQGRDTGGIREKKTSGTKTGQVVGTEIQKELFWGGEGAVTWTVGP